MYPMSKAAKSKKLNARVTPAVNAKLREIVSATGSNMSEVIMKAIECYYRQGAQNSFKSPYEVAKRNRLIGCGEGSGNLSESYKDDVLKVVLNKL